MLTEDILDVVCDVDASIAARLSGRSGEQHTRAITRFDPDVKVAVGETREIAIATDKPRFFDLGAGAAIR